MLFQTDGVSQILCLALAVEGEVNLWQTVLTSTNVLHLTTQVPQGERRLAAIMFTDIVGFTALSQRNESETVRLLDEHRRLVRPLFNSHGGREVKTMGDAFLVEFQSALDAVLCAAAIQQMIHDRKVARGESISLRIGIHVGDVMERGNDILGDAVNIASRIEPLAEEGGICISGEVYNQVRNKSDIQFKSLGEKLLKNVSAPVGVFKARMPWEKESAEPAARLDPKRVAVLPFVSMSPDPNDEYFADGLTEELIDRLCQVKSLEVIARTSVMNYKKKEKGASQIAAELRAGALVEGSVRKAGNKIRVTAQLINANTEAHLWSSKYDRELEDIFEVQSDIAEQVAGALEVQLLPAEREAVEKKTTRSAEALTLCLKGRFYWNERSEASVEKAIRYFETAIEIDPTYARAFIGLADCYDILENWGFMNPTEASKRRKAYIAKALELDDSIAEAHSSLASLLTGNEWNIEEGEREYKRAIELNPNFAQARHWYANGLLGPQERRDEAIQHLREAKRLDPLSNMIAANLGDQLLFSGRYQEAEDQYKEILAATPQFAYAHYQLGAALIMEERFEEGILEIKSGFESDGHSDTGMQALIYAYTASGRRGEAERLLAELEAKSAREYVSNMILAMSNAAAGMQEKAIEYLQKAVAEHSNQVRLNLADSCFDEVRTDPRFQQILETVGIKRKN